MLDKPKQLAQVWRRNEPNKVSGGHSNCVVSDFAKVWEMRTRPTKVRGWIGLIENGRT